MPLSYTEAYAVTIRRHHFAAFASAKDAAAVWAEEACTMCYNRLLSQKGCCTVERIYLTGIDD